MGRRHGLDPALLWLWRRPVVTAWEPSYAMGVAQEKAKRKTHTHTHTHTRDFVRLQVGGCIQLIFSFFSNKILSQSGGK